MPFIFYMLRSVKKQIFAEVFLKTIGYRKGDHSISHLFYIFDTGWVAGIDIVFKKICDGRAAAVAVIKTGTVAAGSRIKATEHLEDWRIVPYVDKSFFPDIAAQKLVYLEKGAGVEIAVGTYGAGHLGRAAHI